MPLSAHFDSVVAVDAEQEMIAVAKREARGVGVVEWVVGDIEEQRFAESRFDLMTVGEAFHRVDQRRVMELAHVWLKPGSCLIDVWGRVLWKGEEPWCRAMAEVVARYGASPPRPATKRRPHEEVLGEGGFEVSSHQFQQDHRFDFDAILGWCRSTSVLSDHALSSRAEQFGRDLRQALLPHERAGGYDAVLTTGCTVGRRPA